jgi:hypothetical protein
MMKMMVVMGFVLMTIEIVVSAVMTLLVMRDMVITVTLFIVMVVRRLLLKI